MTGARARTNTLATLRSSIERIETHGDAYMPDRMALGHVDVDAALAGRPRHGRDARSVRRGTAECGGDRVHCGPRGAGDSPAAFAVGTSGFH